MHRLAQLGAGDLKFVVDVVAPWPELDRARGGVKVPLAELERTYTAVRYRTDRLEANVLDWPGEDYALPRILAEGGICVDQAYFATAAAKARGVPSLLFLGAGKDGRHAWFGYLDGARRWRLDAGRYEEQRYIAGEARDPQPWGPINDHELGFLSGRFRMLPTYERSRERLWLAQEHLRAGDGAAAEAEARRAVNDERRNVAAWDLLIGAVEARGAEAREREGVWREAEAAFQLFPDLQRRFLKGAIAVLRERGQVSAADNEERLLARRFQKARGDLSLEEAADQLARSHAGDTPEEQVRVFRRLLLNYGREGGIDFFDRVVRPRVAHLVERGDGAGAFAALREVRWRVEIAEGSQLERELAELERATAGRKGLKD